MRITVVVGLLTIIAAVAHAEERVRTLDSAPLGVVSFERGSSRVEQESLREVQAVADWQARHPDALLVVEGHASHQGSSTRNLRISEARTDAVRTALTLAGADPRRMVAVAHGDRRGSEQSVVIRATDAFPDLVREQRDPDVGEDARRAGRGTQQRTATSAPATPSPGPGTVVVVQQPAPVVPMAQTPGGEEVDSTAGSTTGLPAGGIAPSTGGNGVAAQTGIGMDPTDGSPEFTTGFGPREGYKGTGATGGAPGFVPPPGPPVLVLPPGAPGVVPPGAPGGIAAGAPTE